MDEMTNQSPVEDDSFEIEEVNESPDEETSEETEVEETEPASETDDNFLQIRYNGQDQFLTREQATTLAQKGMNYDKINQKLQEALDNPTLKVIESNAKKANMSVSDYVNRMAQFQDTLNRLPMISRRRTLMYQMRSQSSMPMKSTRTNSHRWRKSRPTERHRLHRQNRTLL